jgi:hypothetical protein
MKARASQPRRRRTAQMLRRIAGHPLLTKAKFISHLPPSWGTLYDLASLPEPVLREALSQGLVTADLRRREIPAITQKILDRSGQGLIVSLLDRLNVLLGYTRRWPEAAFAAEHLWKEREAAVQFLNDKDRRVNPDDDDERSTFHATDDDIDEVLKLAKWLTKFHATYKARLKLRSRRQIIEQLRWTHDVRQEQAARERGSTCQQTEVERRRAN